MVSPRLRYAVPLPPPVDTTRLRQILGAEILIMLGGWTLPALLAPPNLLTAFGMPASTIEQLVFVRLWGAATFAVVAGQVLAWRAPARHPGAVLVGTVAHGLGAIVIASVGASGSFAEWSGPAAAYIWASAFVMAGFAVGLGTSGAPLLRRLTERPRSGSTKVV